jgi:hypothetical protein
MFIFFLCTEHTGIEKRRKKRGGGQLLQQIKDGEEGEMIDGSRATKFLSQK